MLEASNFLKMDISAQRESIIQRLLSITNREVLTQIEQLLDDFMVNTDVVPSGLTPEQLEFLDYSLSEGRKGNTVSQAEVDAEIDQILGKD